MSPPELEERATRLSSSLLPLVSDEERVQSFKDLVATFVHRTRNLLNGIKMCLYILRRRSSPERARDWAELERVYSAVETLLDRLQMIYKSQCSRTIRCPLGQLIKDRLPTWRRVLSRRGLALDVDAPAEETPSDFDPSAFTTGLDAFVSWRAEVAPAGSRVLIGWRIDGDDLELWWKEDEPASDDLPVNLGVDTLALPLLARITALHGGRLEERRNPELSLSLRWPRYRVPA